MFKNKTITSYITVIWSIAIASLIYTGWPTSLGIVFSLLIIAFSIFCCFSERLSSIPELIEDHITLLLYFSVFVVCVVLSIVVGGKLIPFYILSALGGLLGIISWITDKRYVGKDLKQIFFDECHLLEPNIDLIIVVLLSVEGALHKTFSVSTIILITVFLIDAITQYLAKNK